jgi:hypothetical protein
MFEWMQKYKAWILVFVLVSMMGFGTWGLLQGSGGQDPVIATFEVPGAVEPVELMRSDTVVLQRLMEAAPRLAFATTTLCPNLATTRWNYVDQPWAIAFLAANRLALAAGVPAPGPQVDDFLRASLGLEAGASLEGQSIPDTFREHAERAVRVYQLNRLHETGALAASLPPLMAMPVQNEGPEYLALRDREEHFQEWAKDRKYLHLATVAFEPGDAEGYQLDLSKKPEQLKLLKWWRDEASIALKNQKKIPEKLAVEVAWVRYDFETKPEFDKVFAERFAKPYEALAAKPKIDFPTLDGRYRKDPSAYDRYAEREIERLEKERAENGETTTGDQPSKLDVARPLIEQEIKLQALGKDLIDACGGLVQAESMESRAKARGFNFARVEETLPDLEKNVDFGKTEWVRKLAALAKSQELQPGAVYLHKDAQGETPYDGVFLQPTERVIVVRYLGRVDAQDPVFADIQDWVNERYAEERAKAEPKEKADAFRAAVDAEIDALLAEKKAELEKQRAEAVAKRIADEALDPKAQPERAAQIEKEEQEKVDEALAELRSGKEAAAFEAAAEKAGLTILETGWLETAPALPPTFPGFDDDPSVTEKQRRLLANNARLKQYADLGEGRVFPVLNDVRAGITVLGVVRALREASIEDYWRRCPEALQPLPEFSESPASLLDLATLQRPEFLGLKRPFLDEEESEDEEDPDRPGTTSTPVAGTPSTGNVPRGLEPQAAPLMRLPGMPLGPASPNTLPLPAPPRDDAPQPYNPGPAGDADTRPPAEGPTPPSPSPVGEEGPKPEQPKPEQPKPEQPKPEEPKPEEPKPEQPKPEQPKPEEPKPEEPKPEEPKPEQPKPEQPKPEEPKPEEPKPEEPKPEEPKPEQPKPEQPKPEEPKPEEPKPEQPKPEQPKPEQPKPEQPKPEQPKPEQPKPEQPGGGGEPTPVTPPSQPDPEPTPAPTPPSQPDPEPTPAPTPPTNPAGGGEPTPVTPPSQPDPEPTPVTPPSQPDPEPTPAPTPPTNPGGGGEPTPVTPPSQPDPEPTPAPTPPTNPGGGGEPTPVTPPSQPDPEPTPAPTPPSQPDPEPTPAPTPPTNPGGGGEPTPVTPPTNPGGGGEPTPVTPPTNPGGGGEPTPVTPPSQPDPEPAPAGGSGGGN